MEPDEAAPSRRERVQACVVTVLTFSTVYTLTNYLASLREDVPTATFWWEMQIPLIPAMIIPYWSIDVFFVASPFVCRTRGELKTLVRRILFAILAAGVFFVLLPLQVAYERGPVEGPFGWMFAALFSFDRVFNQAPSLHIALRTILWTVYVPKLKGVPKQLLKGWFILIGVSTIVCHQHQVVDIFTGQLLGQLMIHLFPGRSSDGAPQLEFAKRRNSLGIRYALGATLCVLLAWNLWLWGALFLWPALSLGIVAAAYFYGSPALFRKSHGSFSRTTRWLLMPYTLGAHGSYLYYTRDVSLFSRVVPGVLLGRRVRELSEVEMLEREGVARILDLTAEYEEHPALRPPGFRGEYRNIPILDLVPPSFGQTSEAVRWIEEGREKGTLFVHCSLGFSRSALIVGAYLLKSKRSSSVEDAIAQLLAAQPRLVIGAAGKALLQKFAVVG